MILHLFFLSASLLGLFFEDGEVRRHGIVPYAVEAGDQRAGRLVSRNSAPFGYVVGREGNQIAVFDELVPNEALPVGQALLTDGKASAGPMSVFKVFDGQHTPIQPVFVTQKVKVMETAQTGPERLSVVHRHTVYFKLSAGLAPGARVTVEARDRPSVTGTIVYDPMTVRSEGVHCSQIGFEPADSHKACFFSQWLGWPQSPQASVGAPGTRFWLVDDKTGAKVFEGTLEPSTNSYGKDLDGAPVYRADFSVFHQEGNFRLVVDGAGSSDPFPILPGIWRQSFTVAVRGLFHQRSGIALEEPFTDWQRPRSLHPDDGHRAYQSSATLMDTDQGLDLLHRSSFEALVHGASNVDVPEAWGGWHDAGDWDRRIQHLDTVRALLLIADLKPRFAASASLNIPRLEADLPDILQEALWGLDVFSRLQLPDGGVRGGIESGDYGAPGEASWTDPQRLFVYAPDPWSSYLYAATAARAAYVLMRYAPGRGTDLLQKARSAFGWAQANTPDRAAKADAVIDAENLAAAELFRTTGSASYLDLFRRTSRFTTGQPAKGRSQVEAGLTILLAPSSAVDGRLREDIRRSILWFADLYLSQGRGPFDEVLDPWRGYTWGNVSNIPEAAADILVPAHLLTGDPRYLDAIIGSTGFGLGANPDNMSFTTGLGRSPPREVLNKDWLATGHPSPPPGLTIFGTRDLRAAPAWWEKLIDAQIAPFHVRDFPVHESHQGFLLAPEMTEFSVRTGLREPLLVWGYLAAIRNGED